MADVYLTLDELNKLFQNITIAILGYGGNIFRSGTFDPILLTGTIEPLVTSSDNPYQRVRVAWPTTGAPAWKITDDVCFIRCAESDNGVNRQHETKYEYVSDLMARQITRYTRVLKTDWIFYGPDSYDNARTVADSILYQTYHDMLAAQKIYIIPDTAAPRRVPELFAGQWWERTDLTIYFNGHVRREIEIPYIQSIEIIVRNDVGTPDRTIHINES